MSRGTMGSDTSQSTSGTTVQGDGTDAAANLQMRIARLTLEMQDVTRAEASRTAERLLSGQDFASYRLLLGTSQKQHDGDGEEQKGQKKR
ncbi:hypothetical protein DOTSEDRAFT_23565 [Dothistroma septosporum NZE10]|uniref:Uncharacterized protein n=1 Tax=Dothistroma septosporum (strain NZE10 / CBS 128990) TaxID=675120 RepID=N1PRJ9_DOTSN|nr:hypothetical protein DOTSEDRAFT_23565 [Dothistroma septosporum NZE10]